MLTVEQVEQFNEDFITTQELIGDDKLDDVGVGELLSRMDAVVNELLEAAHTAPVQIGVTKKNEDTELDSVYATFPGKDLTLAVNEHTRMIEQLQREIAKVRVAQQARRDTKA